MPGEFFNHTFRRTLPVRSTTAYADAIFSGCRPPLYRPGQGHRRPAAARFLRDLPHLGRVENRPAGRRPARHHPRPAGLRPLGRAARPTHHRRLRGRHPRRAGRAAGGPLRPDRPQHGRLRRPLAGRAAPGTPARFRPVSQPPLRRFGRQAGRPRAGGPVHRHPRLGAVRQANLQRPVRRSLRLLHIPS